MPRSLRWLGTRTPALVPGPTPARRQTGRGRAVRRFATARQAPCSVTASPGLRSGAVFHKMAFVGPAAGKPRLFGGSSTDRPGPWARVTGLHRSHSDTLEEDLRQEDVTMCFSAVSLRCACNEQAAVASAWWSWVGDRRAFEPPGLGLRDHGCEGLSLHGGDGSGRFPARLHSQNMGAPRPQGPHCAWRATWQCGRGPGSPRPSASSSRTVFLISAGVEGRRVPSMCS